MIVERWNGLSIKPSKKSDPLSRVQTLGPENPIDGLLLVGHGSRCLISADQMYQIRDHTQAAMPDILVEVGFLEMTDPPAGIVLDHMVATGCQRIVILPLMLLAASHSKSDVPAIVLNGRNRHPHVELTFGSPLGVSPELIEIGASNIADVDAEGLPLLVIARGTSEPDANGDAVKASRLLAEWTDTDFLFNGFTGMTWPLVPEALRTVQKLGQPKIAVFFWFLCSGKLIERARDEISQFVDETGVEVVDAGYFGPDERLAKLIIRRYNDALADKPTINCDTCTYRAPFPGYEEKAGQAVGVGHSHLAASHAAGDHGHEHHHG